MKNFIENGDTMNVVAPAGGYTSGDPVVVGDTVGIAVKDAAEGETVALALTGVFQLPKKAAQAISQGVKVYWDATNKEVTTTATANTLMGRAHAAELAAATTINVRLTPTN